MIDWVMNMKKMKNAAAVMLTVLTALLCIVGADEVKESVRSAAERCITTVIPSLFAMTAVSGILIKSGVCAYLGRPLHRVGRFLFGMDGDIFVIFLFSNIAGYPIGAKMLTACMDSGRLSKRSAELLAGVCFGAGPAFIYGCIASQLYRDRTAGNLIAASVVSANIIAALAISVFLHGKTCGRPERQSPSLSAEMLSECVSSAGRSMAEICFAVMAFSAVTALLTGLGAIPVLADVVSHLTDRGYHSSLGLVYSFFDVTAVSALPSGDITLLPVLSALVSFGGLCVFMQISPVCAGRMSILPALGVRIAVSVLSYSVCRVLMRFFVIGEAVSVSASAVCMHSGSSPVPSVLTLIMAGMAVYSAMNARQNRVAKGMASRS